MSFVAAYDDSKLSKEFLSIDCNVLCESRCQYDAKNDKNYLEIFLHRAAFEMKLKLCHKRTGLNELDHSILFV